MLFIDSKDDYNQSFLMITSSVILLLYKNFAVRNITYMLLYYMGISIYYFGIIYSSV